MKDIRPDRHPYQITMMFGVWLYGVTYPIYGQIPSATGIKLWPLVWLLISFTIGCGLTLIGGWLDRQRDPRLSLKLGMMGQIVVGCCMTWLSIYYWNNIPPLGFEATLVACIAVAAFWRSIQTWRLLRSINEYVEEHR